VSFTRRRSAAIVERLFSRVESALGQKLQQHSPYYWLHIYRRLAPENAFNDGLLGTVSLYRRTLELAFFKYGRADASGEFVDGSDPTKVLGGALSELIRDRSIPLDLPANGSYLGPFDFDDFCEFHAVECLAHYLYSLTSCLRWLYKGASLEVRNPDLFRLRPSHELKSLVEGFDRRGEKHSWFATPPGIPLTGFRTAPPSMDTILVPQFNVERLSAEKLGYEYLLSETPIEMRGAGPNFSWIPLDLATFRKTHNFLSDQVLTQFGFSVEDLTSFVAAVSWRFWISLRSVDAGFGWNYLQRAYSYGTLGSLRQEWLETSRVIGSPIPEERLDNLICCSSYDPVQKSQIDLWSRGPNRLILPLTEDRVVVDMVALPFLVHDVIWDIGRHVQDWRPKGAPLEDLVEERAAQCPHASVWRKRGLLRGTDQSSREIDVGIICGDVLFVVDCFALARSLAFDKGKPEALSHRQEKLTAKLEQVDTLAQWLKAHPRGNNYDVPSQIRRLVPLVVSAFVEYIWTRDRGLWLTDHVPRVCTVSEFETILRSAEIRKQVVSRPFVLSLT